MEHRLRGGSTSTAPCAASFVTEQISAGRAAGCTGEIIVRADSGYYTGKVVAACRRAGARFSVTARMDRKIGRAIADIPDQGLEPIRNPKAVWDDELGCWVPDAQVAEVPYTAFASNAKHRTTARLVVHRVKDNTQPGQDELFTA